MMTGLPPGWRLYFPAVFPNNGFHARIGVLENYSECGVHDNRRR
jgi:hypothetical protein